MITHTPRAAGGKGANLKMAHNSIHSSAYQNLGKCLKKCSKLHPVIYTCTSHLKAPFSPRFLPVSENPSALKRMSKASICRPSSNPQPSTSFLAHLLTWRVDRGSMTAVGRALKADEENRHTRTDNDWTFKETHINKLQIYTIKSQFSGKVGFSDFQRVLSFHVLRFTH